MIVTSEAEARAIRAESLKRLLESLDPMEVPPTVDENGSVTWQFVDEVKNGVVTRRRRRITD